MGDSQGEEAIEFLLVMINLISTFRLMDEPVTLSVFVTKSVYEINWYICGWIATLSVVLCVPVAH